MALANFGAQINDLVGAFTDDDRMDTFLTDGLKQIISVLPQNKLMECTNTSSVTSASGFDLETATHSNVISVTRKDTLGISQICRNIHATLVSRVSDPNDLMYASTTDPVFYINDAICKIFPTPTSTQSAEVVYVPLTSPIARTASSIDNFPNDLEPLVVLYAAIKCAQALLAEEEDAELYVPIINTLKADYKQSLNMLGVELGPSQEAKSGGNQQSMLNQMLEYGK